MKTDKVQRSAIAAILLALTLTGCTPSQVQIDCEEAGGEYVSKFSHVLIVGKTIISQYRYSCEMF